MSCISPSVMPWSSASCCAAFTCSAAIHCSQRLNSNRSWCSSTSWRTAGSSMVFSKNQRFSPRGAPHTSKHRHHVAKESRSGPAVVLKCSNSSSRLLLRPASKIRRSAGRFGLPRRVDVHRGRFVVVRGHRIMQRIHLRAHVGRQCGIFGDILRSDVRHARGIGAIPVDTAMAQAAESARRRESG